MLKWPQRAYEALALLFQPLQDIDIFVEDFGDEVFYTELIKRIAPSSARIARVFSAGNKNAVIEAARKHDFKGRAALFLIDGDFEWVRDEPAPSLAGLYRLEAYCIENLLIHERAAIQLVIEEGVVTDNEAQTLFDFEAWLADLSRSLVDLFIWFALLNLVSPQEPTVGRGIGTILTAEEKGLPTLDHQKAESLRRKVQAKVVGIIGPESAKESYQAISARVTALSRPVDVVSGKDFLLPLFEFRLRACTSCKPRRNSLRIRLARHCDPTLFSNLTYALGLAIAAGKS